MKRGAPLKRTPFKRKPLPAHQPAVEHEPRPLAVPLTLHRGTYAGATSGSSVDKERPVRSEAYRRLVAAMPCSMCGRTEQIQAAHANTGKGMALKTDDRTCFPLCADDHRAFDQGGMSRETRRVLESLFGRRTRAAISNAGLWPKNLPKWTEKE